MRIESIGPLESPDAKGFTITMVEPLTPGRYNAMTRCKGHFYNNEGKEEQHYWITLSKDGSKLHCALDGPSRFEEPNFESLRAFLLKALGLPEHLIPEPEPIHNYNHIAPVIPPKKRSRLSQHPAAT